jgi:hypothetical protein
MQILEVETTDREEKTLCDAAETLCRSVETQR